MFPEWLTAEVAKQGLLGVLFLGACLVAWGFYRGKQKADDAHVASLKVVLPLALEVKTTLDKLGDTLDERHTTLVKQAQDFAMHLGEIRSATLANMERGERLVVELRGDSQRILDRFASLEREIGRALGAR